MTNKSDQQGGDGLLKAARSRIAAMKIAPCSGLASSRAAAEEMERALDYLDALPTRDGAEGAEPCHGPQDTTCPSCGLGSPAVAAEPVATHNALADEIEMSNGLILMTVSGTTSQLGIKKAAQVIAALRSSPPIRGDREAINTAADEVVRRVAEYDDRTSPNDFPEAMLITPSELHTELTRFADALSLPIQPVAPRLPQDTLDRLANADASAEEIKDALAKACALYRWNAKLEDLPHDMKDDCYGFAESIKSGAGEREAIPDDQLEQFLLVSFRRWGFDQTAIRALSRTVWKDGIDIERVDYSVMRMARDILALSRQAPHSSSEADSVSKR